MNNEPIKVGSLFSGIGGIELGLEMCGGFETKWFCERDTYARKILAKRWPGIPIYNDVKELYESEFPEPVDMLTGGFPCQPFSQAGKRKGEKDERFLWPEFMRIVRQVKPRWVVVENVPGLLNIDEGRIFARILREISEGGYDAEWNIVSAAGVGAWHKRDRIFIVAYPNGTMQGEYSGTISEAKGKIRGREKGDILAGCGEVLENPRFGCGGNDFNAHIEGDGRWELETSIGGGKGTPSARPSSGTETVADTIGTGTRDKCQPIGGQERESPRASQSEIVRQGNGETGTEGVDSSGSDVGHANVVRMEGERPELEATGIGRTGEEVADTSCPRLESESPVRSEPPYSVFGVASLADNYYRNRIDSNGIWTVEPAVGRVANGIPARVDRLRCLGNAVVPQVAQVIGECIMRYEHEKNIR